MFEYDGQPSFLTPQWVTGFTDGEGCFGIYIYRRENKAGDPLRRAMVHTEFSIGLREDDREVLEQIQAFFGCGHLNTASLEKARRTGASNARDQVHFKVRRLDDLMGAIIPHFTNYPLRSKKARDFKVWSEAVHLLARRKALPLGNTCRVERDEILRRVIGLCSVLREGRNPSLARSENDLTRSAGD